MRLQCVNRLTFYDLQMWLMWAASLHTGAPGEMDRQLRCLVAAMRLRLSADFVGLGANAALRAAQFELFGCKKIGTLLGPYVFWRARRDSNSRPPGS